MKKLIVTGLLAAMVLVGVPASAQTVTVEDDHNLVYKNVPFSDTFQVYVKIKAWDRDSYAYCIANCPSDWYHLRGLSFDPSKISTYYIMEFGRNSSLGNVWLGNKDYMRCVSVYFVNSVSLKATAPTSDICINQPIYTGSSGSLAVREYPGAYFEPPPESSTSSIWETKRCPTRYDGLPWNEDCDGPPMGQPVIRPGKDYGGLRECQVLGTGCP